MSAARGMMRGLPSLAGARVHVRALGDGGWELQHPDPLDLPARCVGEWLEWWARERPQQPFLVDADGRSVTYAEARHAVGQLAQGLIDRGLGPDATLVIVAENALPHALLALAAMHIGVAVCTLDPAWATAPSEAKRVAQVTARLRPALVVSDVLDGGVRFAALARPPERVDVALRFGAIDADTVARYLLTSGSTDTPKLVSTTQRMITANQAQIAQCWPFLAERPPVLLDWLPWSHTFGASHNLHLVLAHGGTLQIDDGRPDPSRIARTVARLRDVRPTLYLSVPRGFAALLPYFEQDDAFATDVLAELDGFFCAGAAIDPLVRERYLALARRLGRRELWFGAGWGATETAPAATLVSWPDAPADAIGLPVPGVTLRLVPTQDRYELRVRGPNVTLGYLGDATLTAAAFDADGFWCSGDAATWIDPTDHSRGLRLDGRLAEDFKLASGTWVNVAAVRAAALARFGALVADVIVCAPDRGDLRVLVVPSDVGRARGLAEVQAELDAAIGAWLREERGSSRVPTAALVLEQPLDAADGERTAKGSVNQRVVWERRAAAVAQLYARRITDDTPPPAPTMLPVPSPSR